MYVLKTLSEQFNDLMIEPKEAGDGDTTTPVAWVCGANPEATATDTETYTVDTTATATTEHPSSSSMSLLPAASTKVHPKPL